MTLFVQSDTAIPISSDRTLVILPYLKYHYNGQKSFIYWCIHHKTRSCVYWFLVDSTYIYEYILVLQDRDHCMQIEELKAEITQRERHIKNLQEEIQKLKDNIDRLMRELEQKGKEMLKVRNDANLQLK